MDKTSTLTDSNDLKVRQVKIRDLTLVKTQIEVNNSFKGQLDLLEETQTKVKVKTEFNNQVKFKVKINKIETQGDSRTVLL